MLYKFIIWNIPWLGIKKKKNSLKKGCFSWALKGV